MACPIHVWLPLTAAAVPFVRIARHKFQQVRYRATGAAEVRPAPGRKRWAPVADSVARRSSEHAEATR